MLLGGGIWFFVSNNKISGKLVRVVEQKDQQNISSGKALHDLSSNNKETEFKTKNATDKENSLNAGNQEGNDELHSTIINRKPIKPDDASLINPVINRTFKTMNAAHNKRFSENNTSSAISLIPDNTNRPTATTGKMEEINSHNHIAENILPANNNLENDITSTEPVTRQVLVNKKVNEAGLTNNSNSSASVIVAKTKKNIGKKKINNSFFFLLSAGADISSAGITNAGKVKPDYGAGIGYTFHNKFTLRTGFYSTRKIYTTSPEYYHRPASFWSYYPDLKQVKSDCLVYEIPLLLSYDFAKFFGSFFFWYL